MILKGTIYLTDKEEVVYNAPRNNTKIVSLDEDGILIQDDSILVGTCLLPPVESKISEADGNEQMYDYYYENHLNEPFQQEFMAALIAYLYKGGNLLLFLPAMDNYTKEKLVFFIYKVFGVHIGVLYDPNPMNANCYYDERCIPIWLNLMFVVDVLDPYEYLSLYPEDAAFNNQFIMQKLLSQISPPEDTINEKINYVIQLHKKLHKEPDLRPVLFSIKGENLC
jgi:hypothetical protein